MRQSVSMKKFDCVARQEWELYMVTDKGMQGTNDFRAILCVTNLLHSEQYVCGWLLLLP